MKDLRKEMWKRLALSCEEAASALDEMSKAMEPLRPKLEYSELLIEAEIILAAAR